MSLVASAPLREQRTDRPTAPAGGRWGCALRSFVSSTCSLLTFAGASILTSLFELKAKAPTANAHSLYSWQSLGQRRQMWASGCVTDEEMGCV